MCSFERGISICDVLKPARPACWPRCCGAPVAADTSAAVPPFSPPRQGIGDFVAPTPTGEVEVGGCELATCANLRFGFARVGDFVFVFVFVVVVVVDDDEDEDEDEDEIRC